MCRIHISLFFINRSKSTAGHSNSIRFWPDRNHSQAIWVSVNPLSDSRWRFIWKSWITAVSSKLRGQSSFEIKNTSFRYEWMNGGWRDTLFFYYTHTKVRMMLSVFSSSAISLYDDINTRISSPAALRVTSLAFYRFIWEHYHHITWYTSSASSSPQPIKIGLF